VAAQVVSGPMVELFVLVCVFVVSVFPHSCYRIQCGISSSSHKGGKTSDGEKGA
jgi:hypothetical protein